MKKGKKTPAEVKEAAQKLLADDKKFDQNLKEHSKNVIKILIKK